MEGGKTRWKEKGDLLLPSEEKDFLHFGGKKKMMYTEGDEKKRVRGENANAAGSCSPIAGRKESFMIKFKKKLTYWTDIIQMDPF